MNATATIAQVLGSIATLILAAAAIPTLNAFFFGPRLTLNPVKERDACTTQTRPDGIVTKAYYLHTLVQKKWLGLQASQVTVFLTRLARRNAAGDFLESAVPVHIPFVWSFPQFYSIVTNISNTQQADLGHLTQNTDAFEFELAFVPNNFDPRIRAGETVRITLQARSTNSFNAPRLNLELHWDGQWIDNNEHEMAKHLTMKPLKDFEQRS